MKKAAFIVLAGLWLGACASDTQSDAAATDEAQGQEALEQAMKEGEAREVHGTEIKAEDIKLGTPLDAAMIKEGQGIYDTKCAACHKLTDERIVGPGWKGVTQKREPAWIMNMITNVDMMLEKDPEAQKLLEQCLVRMPNQNVSQEQARSILEFMRKNDGVN
ncbi:MAG: c-type cytochrome [Cytophagales bacterium]|nr:c-type cytochrome [Cytophagales bacterium]